MSKICFIGGGNMSTSLIGGLIAQGHAADSISVNDPNESKRSELEQQYSIKAFDDCGHAMKNADVVLLAVKPQMMKAVAVNMPHLSQQKPNSHCLSLSPRVSIYSLCNLGWGKIKLSFAACPIRRL